MRWYAHRSRRSLLVLEVVVDNARNDKEVAIKLVANPGTSQDVSFRALRKHTDYTLLSGQIEEPEERRSQAVSVGVAYSTLPDVIEVSGGDVETVTFLMAVRTTIQGDSQYPAVDALQDLEGAIAAKHSLFHEHQQEWQKIWGEGGFEVGGNVELAAVVNSSMYWLLSSARADWPWSLSPGSLASNGYNGHSFWDCETWMFPPLLLTHPIVARSLLEYRHRHTAGAALKALSYRGEMCNASAPPAPLLSSFGGVASRGGGGGIAGCGYEGLMFPWESAFTGNEVCPIAGSTCWFEQHISGDVAFAVWQYYEASGDELWRRSVGFPLVAGIAKFWASRVSGGPHSFSIAGVIPPDEYAYNVTNSAYTNAVARFSLLTALEWGEELGIALPSEWASIANGLPIPFDRERGIHLEYDGYTNDTIKQADVILLGFPLMVPMQQSRRKNDLIFYSEVTDPNGPAMTWSMTAVGYLEIVRDEPSAFAKAAYYFERSFANAQKPFLVWTETPTGGTVNFITGVGGFLQGVAFGYGGLRLRAGVLCFGAAHLLPNSTSLVMRGINYHGASLDVSMDASGERTFSVTKAGPNQLVLCSQEGQLLLLPGSPLVLSSEVPANVTVGACSW
eukprot:TRINITY_DN6053_c0_g1_i6.p1 TRINITY_DN6053_c0_g1~~TRINITY_DN6053_c0_g1_i6.p1  ORF type:complete len:619 (+),score=112.96 TRINITY_DN6053_c0_g1_i6:506-2362(+)